MKLFFFTLMFTQPLIIHSQELLSSGIHHGFNVSANLAFGTHFQRLGINLHFYYRHGQFQANSEIRGYFNFKNLGPPMRYPELVLSQGVLMAYGGQHDFYNPFLSSVSNQTGYRNSVSYSYNAYFNRISTTQQTGIIAFLFDGFSIIAENDILARPMLDRFRTGAFMLQYQYEDVVQAAVNCSMWTGQFGKKQEILMIRAFHNNCYMDTIGARHTGYSHGLLSAQIKYHIGYSQNIQLNMGVDAEQVRNSIQNKLVHNMKILPAKLVRTKNCHLPMLDTEGQLYLYREGQEIRKPKMYFNLFTNANVFY